MKSDNSFTGSNFNAVINRHQRDFIQPANGVRRSRILCVLTLLVLSCDAAAQARPEAPRELSAILRFGFGSDDRRALGYAPLVFPNGTLEHFYTRGEYGNQVLMRIRSKDGGASWSEAEQVLALPTEGKWAGRAGQPMIDRDGNLHLFLLDLAPQWQATWHSTFNVKDGTWSKPQKLSPSGPQNMPIQLRNKRIVMAIGYYVSAPDWLSSVPRARITTYYSDNGGHTWQRSPQTLVVHSSQDYPGIGAGGQHPVLVELNDGRVWMLIRTQTGWLYESFSRDGVQWTTPQATRFRSSNSPASVVRLPTGELVVFWNNCDTPAAIDGQWLYAGRDALHAAISADDGKTWRGFREVYLDRYRNENPPDIGDSGTASPNAAAAPDGRIFLISGEGKKRYKLFHIDPKWLYETHHEDDFSHDLEAWSVFKSYGLREYDRARGHRQDRVAGAERIPHPSRSGAWVLHLRRADGKSGDGAAWNFPAGRSGRLALRILLKKGFGGGLITLTDRFIYPDDKELSKVVFALPIEPQGDLGEGTKLEFERWYTLELAWRVELDPPRGGWPGHCTVTLDGKRVGVRRQLNRARSGISYLRLHSTAPAVDRAGFLIDQVAVDVEP